MTNSQPLSHLRTASTTEQNHCTTPATSALDSERLERSWRELAVLTAEQAAHGPVESLDLLAQLLAYETALRERHPHLRERCDELVAWESSLIHVEDGPASSCVTCRRGRRQLGTATVSS